MLPVGTVEVANCRNQPHGRHRNLWLVFTALSQAGVLNMTHTNNASWLPLAHFNFRSSALFRCGRRVPVFISPLWRTASTSALGLRKSNATCSEWKRTAATRPCLQPKVSKFCMERCGCGEGKTNNVVGYVIICHYMSLCIPCILMEVPT